jgi:hypothetical protein
VTTSHDVPPAPVRRAFVLWIAAVVVGVAGSVLGLVLTPSAPGASAGTGASGIAGFVVGLVVLALFVYLATRMRRGANRARVTLAVLGVATVLSSVVGALLTLGVARPISGLSLVPDLVQSVLVVGAVVSAHQGPAAAWFR